MVLSPFRSIRPFVMLSLFLFLLASCAKYKGGDELDKYVADEEEVIDMAYEPRDDGKPLTDKELLAFRTLGEIDKDMPLEDSQIVELFFKYFVHEKRGTFQRYLDRTQRYLPYMRKVFNERGIPEEMVYVSMVESGGNPVARSRSGAMGLWQFMPFTGRMYGLKQNSWIDERKDPYKATYAAADYFLKLYNDFGDWHLVMASYNAGEGKIGRALSGTNAKTFFELCRLDDKLPQKARLRTETREYVPRIIAFAKIMRSLKNLGFKEPSPKAIYDLRPVAVPAGTNLSGLARNTGLTWDEFVGMNPAYSRTASPPMQATTAYLPPDKISQAEVWLASKEARSFAGWREYRVKRKDTLTSVARRYKISVASLREANGFSKLPRAGATIIIPTSSTRSVEPVYAARADKSDLASRSKGKYAVRSGDTLFSLAQKWGTTVDSIRLANRMGKSSALSIGQRLNIPANSTNAINSRSTSSSRSKSSVKTSSTKDSRNIPVVSSSHSTITGNRYVVKAGDTIGEIAEAANVSSQDLYRANNMKSSSILRIGQTLIIPRKSGGTSAKAPVMSSAKSSTKDSATKGKIAPTKTQKRVVVAKGDTLYSIASKNNVSIDALRKANKLGAKSAIKIGQVLLLP